MNKYKFVLFFSTFIPCLIYSQNETTLIKRTDSIYNNNKGNPKVGIIELNNFIKKQDTLIVSESIAHIYHRTGLLYERSGLYELAVKKYSKASEIRKAIEPINYYKLNNSLYNISNCYQSLNKKIEQYDILKKILDNKSNDKFYYRAHNSLAYLYSDNGDFFTALELLDKVIVSFKTYGDTKTVFKAHVAAISIYSEMAANIENVNQINFHKKEVDLLLQLYPYLYDLAVYNNLGVIYEKIKLYSEALKNYQKALSGYRDYSDSINMGIVNSNIGALYSKLKKHEKAKMYYNNALKITNNKNVIADVYDNLGFYLNSSKSIDKLSYYEKALQTVLNDSSTVYNLPNLKTIKNSEDKLDVLFYLNDIANCLVNAYEEENKIHYLETAKTTLSLIDQVVSLIRYDSSSEKSKLFWISKGVNSYMLAAKVCYLLQDKARMFYFMEKNKSLLLLENLSSKEEKLNKSIPKSILKMAYNLRYDVINSTEAYRLNPNDKTIRKHYLNRVELFANFSDSIKKVYPDYFKIKKIPEILSLKKARDFHVTKDSNFVEYILDDTSGYGVFCSYNETIVFEINEVPKLIKQLKLLREQLKKPFAYEEDYKRYNETSFSVFEKLFPFENALQSISNKSLTIVPDYKLQYLPFEALIMKPGSKDLSMDYLINNVEISYSQSATVFQQIEKRKKESKQNFMGIAPISFNYDSLPKLRKSKKDMEQISSLFPSTLLFNKQATKQSFISNLNAYNIMHLNTHAGLNKNKEPWIAFSDSKLEIKELYGLNNQADLVVLDACKTADGNMQKGEGVMSLSRGFFYGGAKSVVASLWNVNEQSNNEILVSFYKNLDQGQKKSKALNNAKRDYLMTHQNSELSPYYWSSIILTGDIQALKISSGIPWVKITSTLLIIIIIFFIYKTTKSKKV